MVQNFPGQPPRAAVTTPQPANRAPNQTQISGQPIQVTEGDSSTALNYLLTQQAELLTQILIQMKITNYYLQSMTQIPDEPDNLANELLTQREN